MQNQIPKNWQNSKFPPVIDLIKYRSEGNCFVNCLAQACINLGDSIVSKASKPELAIFNIGTLFSPKPEVELKPALDYLVSNGYRVKVIDPEPFKDNNFGSNLGHKLVQFETRNYKIKDVEDFVMNSWQVIISTEIDKKPHAVLVTNAYIYNPTVQQWKKPQKKCNSLITYYANKKEERFLIAIKK